MSEAVPAEIPPAEVFERIADPLERGAALSKLARHLGFRFPRSLAAARRAALSELRECEHPPTLDAIAKAWRIHKSRVGRLATGCVPPAVPPTRAAAGGDSESAGGDQS